MTSTPLKKVQQFCKDRAQQLSKSEEQYAHSMAVVYKEIADYCESEISNEKQMIIDICNECAQDIMRGNIALGKPIGEQVYQMKYA